MVAETLTASPMPIGPTHGYGGIIKRQYFKYEVAANVEDGDIFEVGYLPPKILVTGGLLVGDDLDTGTETLDMDLGWAASGAATDTWTDPNTGLTFTNSGATADPDGFCNAGVWTGDGVTGVYQAGVCARLLVFPIPLYFSAKTKVQFEANAAANATGTGTIGAYIDYILL